MIERFSKAQFEKSLPLIGEIPCWEHVGLQNGEHCYVVHVKEGVGIFIRSSIKADGLAADVAEDSIRLWLSSDHKGTPLGSKDQRWIARIKGWDKRLLETMRGLWRVGVQIEKCSGCGEMMQALKVRNGKPENVGRWFMVCGKCDRWVKWLTNAKEAA